MKRSTKSILIAAAAVIVIAAAVALIVINSAVNPDPEREHSILYLQSSEDENTYVFYDDAMLDTYIPGSVDAYLTCDGSVALMRGGTGLYRADKDGIIKVYPVGVDRAVLSLDNRFALFSTSTKAHVYDHESGEVTEIEGLNAEEITSLVISPNSKAFAVSVIDENGKTMTYVYKDGETKLLRENACIAAIGDDGESGYYVEAYGNELTGKLYYIAKTDKLIAEKAEANFEISRDLREITFDIEEKTHYSIDGSKAKKLMDASVITYAGKSSCAMGGKYCTVNIKDVDSIFDCIYYTAYTSQDENSNTLRSYDLYYVSSNRAVTKLVGGTTRFVIGDDGKRIACLVDNDVYTVSAYNPTSPTKVITNCYTFTCTGDLEEFYAVDNYATLKYVRLGESPVTLLANAYFVIMGSDDTCLCINDYEDNGGSLYYVKNGVCSEEPVANGVYSVEAMHGVVVYYADGSESTGVFDVYASKDAMQFELALEKVQLTKN